jgi:hypothetical protein
MKKTIVSILLGTLWTSASEFFRNSVLLHGYWLDHYRKMNLVFPEAPMNGAIWGIWSLLFCIGIYFLSQKFSLWQTTFLSWFVAFVLMWITIGNLGVLPFAILPIAIPLSLLECFVATYIIIKVGRPKR